MAIEAARVPGQFGHAVQDTDLLLVGQDRQRAPDMGVWHRVVIEVEADVGRLGHRDIQALTQGIDGGGQPQQARLFDGEGLAHGQGVVLGPGPIEGPALAPGNSLRVEIVDTRELACGEEALAEIGRAHL